ncbi:MAG TPA: hypothetical protein PKZ27_02805 [Rhodocyclaceae bacterium]|nr:hypothetical protein [Terrimesophilobacter sp.]HRO59337.1 hypothetical protein [Burkholderiaceae bacterium]HRP74495.1 hypothetical protein [Rhodocyclaceae bacterium]
MAWITLDAAGIYYEVGLSETPVSAIESGIDTNGINQEFNGTLWSFSFTEYAGADQLLRVVYEPSGGSATVVAARIRFNSEEGMQTNRFVWVGGSAAAFDEVVLLNNHYENGDGSAFVDFVVNADFENLAGTFRLYVEGEEPPAGECFWTDLVNATQVCSDPPDPGV